MSKREALKKILTLLRAPFAPGADSGPASHASRPNVLFIVADDLNAWIGAIGRHPDVKTPNIDALAARGTLFSHTYCPAPYCNASRMSVFTGRLPSNTGIYQNEPLWDTPDRATTFVETLRQAGYYTFGAGKVFHGVFDYPGASRGLGAQASWREIENRPFLWDEFHTNVTEPLPDDRPVNKLFPDVDSIPNFWYHLFDWGPLPNDREGEMPDTKVAEAVENFLKSPPKEPFFCAAGFYKPHLPWHVPQRFFDLYDPATISLPLVKDDDLDDVPDIAREWALSPPDHELVTKHGQWRQAVHGYLAAISYADSVIGRVVAALDASGRAEDTIIVLWADNGFHLGEKLHWRKFVLWEEATRVPLIIVPPNPRKQQRVHAPVSLVDIYPTLLDLCGVQPSTPVDGASLRPALEGGEPSRSHAVMTWGKGNHSIRTTRWRFTRYHDGSEELYDHHVDPYEWTNVAGVQEFAQVAAHLRSLIPKDTG